ncbi:HAD-IA family hydrolase [Prevotella melaninogenica]|uniref:HAD-IA family hydrolase n=1 Tax=Prevotella melaninogenica TaxID=28132 RepID=UPI001C5F705D|nr:HAD-IA family hydrolase [Prevotella melaninogenica]MBW4742229.1 HAD-IA family hydrolase [Prevotella melaninogenica]MBW4912971.1 HAD-IA family hydrolase [Prevotella melaninogenica]
MSIKGYLQKLSFRTGVIVLLMCIPFYILSFVQVFFPVSAATKGILFTVFFGLAKSFQYGGIAILGKEGYKQVKGYFKRKKQAKAEALKGNGDTSPRYCPDLFSNPEILSGIRLVIFDFDGTLGDSQKLITDTMLATIERLNLPMRSREECARTIGLPLKECFSSIIPMTDEQAEECAKVYSEIFNVKNVPGVVKAFPGVVETLERLSSQGILMSIASSRSHRTLAKLMDELDLSKYITYLIAADDVVEKKPAAESVLKTLSHFNIEAHETLVVGDTEFDILMGRNAGTHTCGVTYGNSSRESLEAAKAEWIVC